MSKSLLALAEQRHQKKMGSLREVMSLQLNAECSGTSAKIRWTNPITKNFFHIEGIVKKVSTNNFDDKLNFLIEFTCPETGSKQVVSRTAEELYE